MKKFLVIFLVMSALFVVNGCKDDPVTPQQKTCSPETGTIFSSSFDLRPVNLTYNIILTGDAKVTELEYYGENGAVKVANPGANWTILVSATSQDTVNIKAVGTVTDGSIKVEYVAVSVDNPSNTTTGSDYCEQTNS